MHEPATTDKVDPHAAVIASDTAHDQRQVDFEITNADESIERMFAMLFERISDAQLHLDMVKTRVGLKQQKYRQDRDELHSYADKALEQLGSFRLLLSKVGDAIDGIPDPAARTNGATTEGAQAVASALTC